MGHTGRKYDRQAASWARSFNQIYSDERRGVRQDCISGWEVPTWVAFGSGDDVDEPGAQEEVELFSDKLSDLGCEVIGFGLSDDGRTWAMLFEVPNESDLDEDFLNELLFRSWCEVNELAEHGLFIYDQ